MNRKTKKKLSRNNFQNVIFKHNKVSDSQRKIENPFSNVPLETLCQSIWLLIEELQKRDNPIYDFDHKEKFVQRIKIIRNKIYFLAAEEKLTDGKQ